MSQAINRLQTAKDDALSAARSARKAAAQLEIEIGDLGHKLLQAQQRREAALAYAAECESSAATIQEAIEITAARERRLRLYGGQDPITTTNE